jgi:hypothetical protein
MGHWIFEELRGGPRRTPQEAELFKDDQSDEGEYAGNDHLVREVLQNSLDARSESADGPVQVSLALHDASDAPAQERLTHFFARLKAPLAGREIEFHRTGAPWLPCRFLVCEDFGTRGLEGDATLFSDPEEGDRTRQDFYWFWRNIGRSAKTGDDLGRWGLGKTVFRAVSRVGSMFGLTIRESDRVPLLMGQAVLQPHQFDDVEYHPEGYWCREIDEDLPMPIGDVDEIATFRREWHLSRTVEPGTSVVAPFVPDELKAERILQAVIVHFFTRILRGELEVEVSGPELGKIAINADSIEDAANRVTWNGSKRMKRHMAPPIAFVKRCLSHEPEVFTEVLGVKSAPELNDDSLPASDLAGVRRRFGDGELVSLRIRIALPRRNGDSEVGEIDVYLQRNPNGSRCDSYYVREGMTITRINSRAGLRGVQALVIVDPGPMAELLGDTEGPAHEDWSKSADRPNKDWKNWSGRVGFARRIVDNLVEYLTPPSKGPDRELLADFFSIERTQGGQRGRSKGEKEKGDGKFPAVKFTPKWFHITERTGGFTVARNRQVPLPNEAALRVAVAYDLPRGNPLRNWSPIDFEISNKPGGLKPTGEGLKPKLLQGNVVQLDVDSDSFVFSLDGFDRYRDLYVRVDDVSGAVEQPGEQNND